MKIWKAQVLTEEWEGAYGQIVMADKSRLYVKTGKGTLSVEELQLEGKKRMDTASFLRGFQLRQGSLFERRN